MFQIKYLYAEHVFGWGAEQVREPWQLVYLNFVDLALVGLLHQFYRQRASAPHPATDALYVLPPYIPCV